MLSRLGSRLARFFRAVTPDPFVLAIFLTALTAGLALWLTPSSPRQLIDAWQGPRGFYGLLSFSMQMCLVLVTGHALASTPLVGRAITWLSARPKTGPRAAALVAAVAMTTALLNWGLGLIVGALFAREVGKSCQARGVRVHYPLLAAAGYTGLMVWHGGFSGSAPLKVTTQKDLIELLGPKLASTVLPVSTFETILSPLNLFVSGGLLLIIPIVVYFLMPATDSSELETIEVFSPKLDRETIDPSPSTLPERIETSAWTMTLLGGPLLVALVVYFWENGLGRLDPNAVNLTLFTAGLILHRHPRAYARAIQDAVGGCAGIILQFPLYAGIMGMMTGTGLAQRLASWAASTGSIETYSLVTFLSAGVINFFVPSGGGQWAVQGPIAVEAATRLGVPLGRAVMAVAYGDQWSNMLQPFWALPLLGITGVRVRDIIGYTAVIMVVGGAWFALGLLVFARG